MVRTEKIFNPDTKSLQILTSESIKHEKDGVANIAADVGTFGTLQVSQFIT